MADQERTVHALSVKILSDGEDASRKMTLTASFTVDGETWEVAIPEVPHDELRRLLGQVMRAIGTDQHVAGLTQSGNFTVTLNLR